MDGHMVIKIIPH